MKITSLFILSFIFFISCQDSQKKNKPDNSNSTEKATTKKEVFTPMKSFAVVWDWTRGNTVEDIIPTIQEQVMVVMDLWRKGIIENAYVDNESELNDSEKFTNAFFVIKGKSEKEVRAILNNTPAYLAGITKYELYPIGVKWLKRNNSKSIEKVSQGKKSFAAVWTIIDDDKYEEFLGQQNAKLLELWNEGLIENAYLDVEKIGKENEQSPALVFFINASSKEKAAMTLDDFPFVKQNIGKYSLYPVGTFLMSTPEDQNK